MNTRRVVVTGMGAIDSLGSSLDEICDALRTGRSGTQPCPEFEAAGMTSHVAGLIDLDPIAAIDNKKITKTMGPVAAYAYLAMQQAIAQAQLGDDVIRNLRTGLIVGEGGASLGSLVESVDILRVKGLRRVRAGLAAKVMGSTASANLARQFSIFGPSFAISSACATGTICIGEAVGKIRSGECDVMFAGGADEVHWAMFFPFDAMHALSRGYNADPGRASRPWDRDRDGFVPSGGAGVIVLELLEHAQDRGAEILAEIVGYGNTTGGESMTDLSVLDVTRCMNMTLCQAGIAPTQVDYINAHGTSTPAGDIAELRAIQGSFNGVIPPISSTKSMTGHALGAAGALEAIYTILMMRGGFIAPTINVEHIDPEAEEFPIVCAPHEVEMHYAMSNSFGFGGTNASLILRRWYGE